MKVFDLIDEIPLSPKGRVVQTQLAKAASSAAANYRAAQRSRSRADFILKMSIALEEIDETAFWLEFLPDTGIGLERVRESPSARSRRVVGHFYVFTQNCAGKREKQSLEWTLVHFQVHGPLPRVPGVPGAPGAPVRSRRFYSLPTPVPPLGCHWPKRSLARRWGCSAP